MAPEGVEGEGHYNMKVDIYSFAIILYEMLYGKNPLAKMPGKLPPSPSILLQFVLVLYTSYYTL